MTTQNTYPNEPITLQNAPSSLFVDDKEYLELAQKVKEKTGEIISKSDPLFVTKVFFDYWQEKFVENFNRSFVDWLNHWQNKREAKETEIFEQHLADLRQIIANQKDETRIQTNVIDEAFQKNLAECEINFHCKKEDYDSFFKEQTEILKNSFHNARVNLEKDVESFLSKESDSLEGWNNKVYQTFWKALQDSFQFNGEFKQNLEKMVKEAHDNAFSQTKKEADEFEKRFRDEVYQARVKMAGDSRVFADKSSEIINFANHLSDLRKDLDKQFEKIKIHSYWTTGTGIAIILLFVVTMIMVIAK